MNMSLQNKCALITGSFAGLGHAIAERLAREGANVVLTGLESEEDARRIVERMN
jgi:NAD(P)-dependent dehydrogenase (short-subunit alcohol dehydrogenase family)